MKIPQTSGSYQMVVQRTSGSAGLPTIMICAVTMIFYGELRTTIFQTYVTILGASSPCILISYNVVIIYEMFNILNKSEI